MIYAPKKEWCLLRWALLLLGVVSKANWTSQGYKGFANEKKTSMMNMIKHSNYGPSSV